MFDTRYVNSLYFEWLIALVGPLGQSYTILLEKAFDVTFYELVENDINREEDGLALREQYAKETGSEPDIDGCTLLEVLIALGQRLNTVAYDYENPDRSIYWFWVLIDNLGMRDLSDGLIDPITEDDIRRRFNDVVQRSYRPNGRGGIFPLKRTDLDQRERELWYQMMDWLEENIDDFA
jgi:hypothetical protein